jgi:hypothetical protein
VSVDFSETRALEFVRSSDPAARRLIRSMAPAHPARLALSELLREVGADDTLARRSTEGQARNGYAGHFRRAATPRNQSVRIVRKPLTRVPAVGGSVLGRATRRLHLLLPSR